MNAITAITAITTKRLILVAVFMFLADLPWLSIMGGPYNMIAQAIQGGAQVRMRPVAGLIVYPALAFLALKTTDWKDAFFTGASVYAVYDFTVYAIFEKYPVWLACADTLWGGVLFTLVWFFRQRFGI